MATTENATTTGNLQELAKRHLWLHYARMGAYDQGADIPVLVRGGGKASEEEIFRRTAALMEQGASGIVYGRNVIQHASPARMTRALMAIVHEGASPEAAMKILSGRG